MQDTRAVLFDMDGVIVDAMHYHVKAWQQAFQKYTDIGVPSKKVYLAEGVRGEEFINQIVNESHTQISSDLKNAIHDDKRRIFQEIFKVDPVEGIVDLINLLDEYDYQLGVVSGSGREAVDNVLKQLHLNDTFSAVVSGDDVKDGKPSPEPFLTASGMLDIPPELCIVIENAPLGIESAKKAGMLCIAINTSLGQEYLTKADMVVTDHRDIMSLFEREYNASKGKGKWLVS